MSHKVSVPQAEGRVTIHHVDGLYVKESDYKVTDGHISVAEGDLDFVLSKIEGAQEVKGNSSDSGPRGAK